MQHPKRISLTGMMGAGKSTIGRRLARHLDWPFADSDSEIEAAAGMRIADIFEDYGEAEFRRLEARVIERLLSQEPLVLATGGGAVTDAGTRRRLRRDSLLVWLDAPLDVLVRRTLRKPRPLLAGGDREAVLAELLEKRRPLYEEAHIIISRNEEQPPATVKSILDALPQDWVAEQKT